MNPRVLLIIAIIVFLGYGVYLMTTPPKPQVVVVRPTQNQSQSMAAPAPPSTQFVGCTENVYLKIWGTEICGGSIYYMEYRNNAYTLYIENVSIRGKFILQDSGCTVVPQPNGWIKLMCKSYIIITQ